MPKASEFSHSASNLADDSTTARAAAYRAWLAVAVAVLVLVGVGWWGLTAVRGSSATVGTPVGHDGGTFTVVSAWTLGDPMAAMDHGNADQFAASGMPMTQMIPDAVPEGFKRVAVELDLVAGNRTMEFAPDEVTLVADGTSYAPYNTLLADGSLPPGAQLNAFATFEVPVATDAAEFHLTPDAKAVAVDVSGMDPNMDMDHDE